MPKKKTSKRPAAIGEDPFEAMLTTKPAARPGRRRKTPAGTTPKTGAKPASPPKVRATFHLSKDLLEEARDTVVALSGPPVRLTLAELAETALRREVARLKKKHNGGEAFPPRGGDLRGGRPIGS